ncbi:MAG: FAD-dependent oxidoreductase [Desulfurivibrio sp.]|nr:FAD-dependent oxidoreductase [Desulfurivibrio sp.]
MTPSCRTDKILIATGGWPTVPDLPGAEYGITSNEAFHLDELPDHILVVGGGYIAVEFAGIFAGLGVETHLSYRGSLFLRGFDHDVREAVRDELVKKNIALHFESVPTAIERTDDGRYAVQFRDGSSMTTGLVMFATGRHPNVHDIGIENVDVRLRDNGAVMVDDDFRTSVPNIFALGDVTDRYQLTPVAIAEAMAFAQTQFLGRADEDGLPPHCDGGVLPADPGNGRPDRGARRAERFGDIDVYRSSFRALKHTLSGNEEKTLMKLIVDRASDKVIGVHMVGAEAGEIIQGMAVALKAGATKAVFDATVGIHPTTAEEFVTMRDKVATMRAE